MTADTDLVVPPVTAIAPHRSGCLTAILLVFGGLSALASLVNLFGAGRLARNLPNAPSWASEGIVAVGVLGALSVLGLAALWRWQRWGLYLYFVVGLAVFGINVNLVGLLHSLLGLLGLALVVVYVRRPVARVSVERCLRLRHSDRHHFGPPARSPRTRYGLRRELRERTQA